MNWELQLDVFENRTRRKINKSEKKFASIKKLLTFAPQFIINKYKNKIL
jgi:hypothetical protein